MDSMNKPHVECLEYSISTLYPDEIDLSEADPLSHTVDRIGDFAIAGTRLNVAMAVHCPTEAEARSLVEPVLRTWEMHSDLSSIFGAIRFRFSGSRSVDLEPPGGVASFGVSENIGVTDSVHNASQVPEFPATTTLDFGS